MRLGTKLTIYLSLIIVLVLSGYGYLDILSRRSILINKMKTEVRSTVRTLKVSLEAIQLPEELDHVQGLIDAVSEPRTLGVIVYYQKKDLIFHSPWLEKGVEPYLGLVKKSIREDRPQEAFDPYRRFHIF